MATLTVQLPDALINECHALVRMRLFSSVDEVVEQALRTFLDSSKAMLAEQHQLEDIAWALQRRNPP